MTESIKVVIEGVKITKLKQLVDERGKIMHMIRNDSPIFDKFGEIYFSFTNPQSIKAWHMHKEMTLNYVCIEGKVKFVLYDDREKSKSKGEYENIILSPKKYFLITIPPNIWNGFKGLAKGESIIANCLNLPHNEKEMVRLDINEKRFSYNW